MGAGGLTHRPFFASGQKAAVRLRTGTLGRRGAAFVCAIVLLVFPMSAEALEVSGGVSLGGILAGISPRLAVSPHANVSWRAENGWGFAAHDILSILPATSRDGVGVHNQTSVTFGYGTEKLDFNIGPSLSVYSMPACGIPPGAPRPLCGRVVGVAPGGHAQADVYFAGPLGVSVSANVEWVGGNSAVLPGSVAAMVLAGPVVRWRSQGM